MATDEVRKDLRAAVEARRELGPDYEEEVIDGFLAKVDARISARAAEVAHRTAQAAPAQAKGDPGGLALAICSVGAGIPITAIAANQEGLLAIIVCWGGLVGVNLARSINRFVGR